MYSRRRLLSLLQNARLAPAGRLAAAPPSRNFSLPRAAAGAASTSGEHFPVSLLSTPHRIPTPGSSDGHFSCKGSTYAAILIGQAAVVLGLSSNSVLAQDDSTAPAVTSGEADVNVTGLRRIEDGSVISNEHTIKWRMCTDKAREFFLQANEAEKLFKAALQEAKEGFGLRDPHSASALNNLAEFYRLRKEHEKAEPLYLEAIEILEQSFGPDDIRVGAAFRNLGQHYYIQRRFDQAQTCFEVPIEGRVMGLGNPDYANTMYLLAKVLSQQGKGKDAEALIRESIRILEEAGLGESPACIQRMKFLSLELVKSKQLAEAENLQRKILHNLELSKGWNSLDTTAAAETLSVTLQNIGNLKESEELLERCLTIRRKILSEDHFEVAGLLVHLARLTLLKITSDIKVNNDLSLPHLVKAKQLVNDSIRITEGILNPSRENRKKRNSTFAMEREKIGATAVLLQALEVVGLLEAAKKRTQAPVFDYQHVEQALRKCISLYNEPQTRNVVSKALRQHYLKCLRSLTLIVQRDPDISNAPQMQDLVGESQQIVKELGKENDTK
ncbi:kinesin light chain 3 [Hordeum vulgare]|nr:kinesin light chain 3 [Hordeum vulgare]